MSRFLLIALLCLSTLSVHARNMERGPVRDRAPSLDLPNPNDNNYVLYNGALAMNITNWGFFGNDGSGQSGSVPDPCDESWAPQFEYPAGSGVQYLFQGGLWVGAKIEQQGSFLTRVSVGTDGWQNPSINEFHAGEGEEHGIVVRSNLPSATDCFANSIYDPSAEANIEVVSVFSDTLESVVWVRNDPTDGPHVPLGIKVTQTARAWTSPEFARFVILDYKLENIGPNFLKDLTFGLYLDSDVGSVDENEHYVDDISGSIILDPQLANILAWSADDDGREANDPNGPLIYPNAIGAAALTQQDTINGDFAHCFNWYIPNGSSQLLDYGPSWVGDSIIDCGDGYPAGDTQKFGMLINRERDYDQTQTTPPAPQADTAYHCASDDSLHDWCPMETIYEAMDTRFVLSWSNVGIFDYIQGDGRCVYRLNPGEHVTFSAAMVIGEDFWTEGSTEHNTEGLVESFNRARSLFDGNYGFQPPTPVTNLRAMHASSGQVPLAWSVPEVGGNIGYRVFGKPNGGLGQRVEFTTGLITAEIFTVTGLTNGDGWLFEVETQDANGYHSAMAERLVRVGAIPNDLVLHGQSSGGANTLTWQLTPDPSIAFYHLHRTSSADTVDFDLVDVQSYLDDEVVTGRAYQYSLTLSNSFGIESYPTNTVTLTPFLPTANVLVYDETKTMSAPDSLGRGSVSDQLIRGFYEALLSNVGEQYDYVEVLEETDPLPLEQLAQYEVVLWHSENYKQWNAVAAMEREQVLSAYVSIGGKLIRFGRHTMLACAYTWWINNNQSSLARLAPFTFDSVFVSGPLVLGEPTAYTRTIGAANTGPDFPALAWDLDKVRALHYLNITNLDYLIGVDLFWRRGNTWPLYTVNFYEDDSTGYDNNTPCAVLGPGEIMFGFPLYFLPADQAEALLEAALAKLRSQELASPEPRGTTIPERMSLAQNYPNPFNATTTIEFALPKTQDASLRLYNIRGQLVTTLTEGRLTAGTHRITFDASPYASGLYIYRLETGDRAITKKMLLLK